MDKSYKIRARIEDDIQRYSDETVLYRKLSFVAMGLAIGSGIATWLKRDKGSVFVGTTITAALAGIAAITTQKHNASQLQKRESEIALDLLETNDLASFQSQLDGSEHDCESIAKWAERLSNLPQPSRHR